MCSSTWRAFRSSTRPVVWRCLFGSVTAEGGHAYSRRSVRPIARKKCAFEQFIDFVWNRLRRWPDLHVYHYSHYEPTALKRLTALRHVKRRLTSCSGVKRSWTCIKSCGGRSASHDSYSIKAVRQFFMPDAGKGDVSGGTESMIEYQRASTRAMRASGRHQALQRRGLRVHAAAAQVAPRPSSRSGVRFARRYRSARCRRVVTNLSRQNRTSTQIFGRGWPRSVNRGRSRWGTCWITTGGKRSRNGGRGFERRKKSLDERWTTPRRSAC
jgi:hypothetical protein